MQGIRAVNSLLLTFFILVSKKLSKNPYFCDREFADDTIEQVVNRMNIDIRFLAIRVHIGNTEAENFRIMREEIVRIVMYCAVVYFKALEFEAGIDMSRDLKTSEN